MDGRLGKAIVVIGLTFSMSAVSFAQEVTGSVAEGGKQSNLVAVELLGRAGVYSANYERNFLPRIGVGVGGAYWGIDHSSALIVPMYISTTPIGKTHSLYAAAGVTLGISKFFNFSGSYTTDTIGTVSVGYQFRSREGFVIRPTMNILYTAHDHLVWPGVMIGHYF